MCMFSQQNPQELHFEKYYHCFWNLAPHALCFLTGQHLWSSTKVLCFYLYKKPHNIIGCQENEQLGKI